jgi:hypothetical protein
VNSERCELRIDHHREGSAPPEHSPGEWWSIVAH